MFLSSFIMFCLVAASTAVAYKLYKLENKVKILEENSYGEEVLYNELPTSEMSVV
jgi:hypothetical protein